MADPAGIANPNPEARSGRKASACAWLYSPLMFRFLKRLLKWALIIAAIAGIIRWLKNRSQVEDAEADPGSIEPWPPLDTSDIAAGDGDAEAAGA